jgi:hypothetical protein
MLKRLRQFSNLLGSIPSLLYALVYLALIPSFAALYYFALPRDFYHSTAQFEYGPMSRASDRILDGLQQAILNGLGTEKAKNTCGQWQIDRDHVRPYALQIDGNDVVFSLRVIARQLTGQNGRVEEHIPIQISFALHPMIRSWPPKSKVPVDQFEIHGPQQPYKSAFKGDLGSEELLGCVFPAGRVIPAFPAGMVIRVPSTLTEDIIKFSNAKRGFPSQVDGQFVRMLYLSATTITTLGFGDIVPLTTPARLAISIEAVIGIVMMGLFLNAVSRER